MTPEPTDAPGDDPLDRLERNARSTRSAFVHLGVTAGAVLLTALAVLLLLDPTGSACTGRGGLCSSAPRTLGVLLPTGVGVAGAVVASVQCYRRWRDRVRWRAWLLVTQLLWLVTSGYLLVSASLLFVGR